LTYAIVPAETRVLRKERWLEEQIKRSKVGLREANITRSHGRPRSFMREAEPH
jgi:hypothetical protein